MKYTIQPKCALDCYCHTEEALEFNRGENLPAIDCCEHCCELWKEHNKEVVYLKIAINNELLKKLKYIVKTDHRVMPMEREIFKQKRIVPRFLTEKIEKHITQVLLGEIQIT